MDILSLFPLSLLDKNIQVEYNGVYKARVEGFNTMPTIKYAERQDEQT